MKRKVLNIKLKGIAIIALLMVGFHPVSAQEILEVLEGMEDEKGKTKFTYLDNVLPGIEDIAIVGIGKKRGLANIKGELIIPMEYQNIEVTEFGEDLMVKQKGKVGIMDFTGKILIPIEYSYLETAVIGKGSDQKFYAAAKGKKYGILKADGTVFCPLEYYYIDFGGGDDIVAYVGMKKGPGMVVLSDGTVRERGDGE
jgi:hypothetical protein